MSFAQERPKTVIQGRHMEVLRKGELTKFSGGVTLTRGDDFMSADRMVNREKEGVTEAWGNVYLRRKDPARGARSEAWGDAGVYDSNTTSGTLRGRVFIEVKESTPAARTTRIWSSEAAYRPDEGAMKFTGAYPPDGPRPPPSWPAGVSAKPRVLQWEKAGRRDLWGDRVTYFETDGRVVAEGRVRAFWEGDDVLAR